MQDSKMDHHCKICGLTDLNIFAHTAKCGDCGVLLYYPYPVKKELVEYPDQDSAYNWYSKASNSNYNIFRNAVNFTVIDEDKNKIVSILDFGGGGRGSLPFPANFSCPNARFILLMSAMLHCLKNGEA